MTKEDLNAELAEAWPPGTVVTLQSGGPQMTVSHVHDGKVCVVYWQAVSSYLGFGSTPQHLEGRGFHPDVLRKAS